MDTSSDQELDQRNETPPADIAETSEATNQSSNSALENNQHLENDTGHIVGVVGAAAAAATETTTDSATATGASLSSGGSRAIGVSDNHNTPRSCSDVAVSFDDRLRQQRECPRFLLPPETGRGAQRSVSCGSSSAQAPFFGHSAASSTHQSQLRKMVASHPPTSYSGQNIPSNLSPLTAQYHTAASASHHHNLLPSGPAPPPIRSSSASSGLSDRASSMTLQHAASASESLTAYLPSSLNVNNNNRTTNPTSSSDSNTSSNNPAPHRYSNPNNKGWTTVETSRGDAGGTPPCARSLHTAAILNGNMYIFGGYNGQSRLNDFYCFSFAENRWSPVIPAYNSGNPPSPRDRHVSCVIQNPPTFIVFGGFDGTSRVNDCFGFDFTANKWLPIIPTTGVPPSPRHSHSAIVYEGSLYIFGGYDGSYRSDFCEFNFSTTTWSTVAASGRPPRARYRATCVLHDHTMILFGGHDGTRHLSDTHLFDFHTHTWTNLVVNGIQPIPRDSHVSVVHVDSMYVFGGSTGSAMNDLHELQLPSDTSDVATWSIVKTPTSGSHRFCHSAVVYEDSMFVFGGYDGASRLNDFIRFDFDVDDLTCDISPSTLKADLRSLLHNDSLSDVTFVVEDIPVPAHKIMMTRSTYFRAMLMGDMMESSQSLIRINEVRHSIFLCVLEYLYTDDVEIELDSAMELFVAADLFDIPRLQLMCERTMLESITLDNAATIFHAADMHSAYSLRNKTLRFIVKHFEAVSKTPAFEEMARGNVELVFEILRSR